MKTPLEATFDPLNAARALLREVLDSRALDFIEASHPGWALRARDLLPPKPLMLLPAWPKSEQNLKGTAEFDK